MTTPAPAAGNAACAPTCFRERRRASSGAAASQRKSGPTKGNSMKHGKHVLAAGIAASLVGLAAAAPYPHGKMTAYDMGATGLSADGAQITVTIALNLRNREQLERL